MSNNTSTPKTLRPLAPGEWRIPRRDRGYGHWVFIRYRVADPTRLRVGVNRVLGYRIGWFVVVGRWCYSLAKPQPLEAHRERAAQRL